MCRVVSASLSLFARLGKQVNALHTELIADFI